MAHTRPAPTRPDAGVVLARSRARGLLARLCAWRLAGHRAQPARAGRAGVQGTGTTWHPVSLLLRRHVWPEPGRAQIHLHQFVLRLRQSLQQTVLRHTPVGFAARPTVIRMTPRENRQNAAQPARPPDIVPTRRATLPAPAPSVPAAPMQVLRPWRPASAIARRQPRHGLPPSPNPPYRPLTLTLARATASVPASAAPAPTTPAPQDLAFNGVTTRPSSADPAAAPATGLPARELQRVTAHVMAQLERRARSWRERTQQA